MNADLSMMGEVFYDHQYDPIFFEIKRDDVIFDIGAHVWYFSIYAAYRAKQVHSFEPFYKNFIQLQENIKINDLKNVVSNNIALGDSQGEVEFYEHQSHTGCHSLYKRGGIYNHITVKKETLGQYMKEHNITKVNLLKLDCEGAEYEIINSLPEECFVKIDKICMEIHEDIVNISKKVIIDKLEKVGYSISYGSHFIYALKK